MRGSSLNFLLEKQLSKGLLAGYGPVAPGTTLATPMVNAPPRNYSKWLLSTIGTRLLTTNSHKRHILACPRHSVYQKRKTIH